MVTLKQHVGDAKGAVLKEFSIHYGVSSVQNFKLLIERGALVHDHRLFVKVRGKINCLKDCDDGCSLVDYLEKYCAGRTVRCAHILGVVRQQIEKWLKKDAFFYKGWLYISVALNDKKTDGADFDLSYMKLELTKLQRDLSKQTPESLKRYLIRLAEAV